MDLRLELVVIPVSDVDRSKAFYADQFGFNSDHDHVVTPELRFVQLTPPGSACSIAFGVGLSDAEPGSVKGLQVVTGDIEETQRALRERGLDPGEVDDQAWGRSFMSRIWTAINGPSSRSSARACSRKAGSCTPGDVVRDSARSSRVLAVLHPLRPLPERDARP